MRAYTQMLLIRTILSLAAKPLYRSLKIANTYPKKESASTLRRILTYAKDSQYGKEHHFEEILQASTEDELFQRYEEAVPANDYESLRPYVEQHKHGQSNVLFPGKPVMYATTSGTTAEPKWIPITHLYLKRIYGHMSRMWLSRFAIFKPHCYLGKALVIVGKAVEGYAPDGTMFGSVSGLTERDVPHILRNLFSSPGCVGKIADYNARYYVHMRLAIEQNITIIVTPNPSTVVELLKNANANYDSYCDDVEHGTLRADLAIEPEVRAEIEALLKPNPKRAAELRAIKAQYGEVLPKHFWPNMQILNTWKCGNTSIFLDKIRHAFPEDILHMELGYFASECRFGTVLDEKDGTVMYPHYHYYEFVAEEEMDAPKPRYYRIHELEEGRRYVPYVTTFAGLYRYNMNDLIEAGPKFMNTPTFKMVQKVHGIVSLTGEKLYERQFVDSVHEVEKAQGVETQFFVGFANPDADDLGYKLYFEFKDPSVTQEQAESFAQQVDQRLIEKNIEYRSKRESLRLRQAQGFRLMKDSFEMFKQRSIAEGFRDGQFKINLLLHDEKRHAKFKDLLLKEEHHTLNNETLHTHDAEEATIGKRKRGRIRKRLREAHLVERVKDRRQKRRQRRNSAHERNQE